MLHGVSRQPRADRADCRACNGRLSSSGRPDIDEPQRLVPARSTGHRPASVLGTSRHRTSMLDARVALETGCRSPLAVSGGPMIRCRPRRSDRAACTRDRDMRLVRHPHFRFVRDRTEALASTGRIVATRVAVHRRSQPWCRSEQRIPSSMRRDAASGRRVTRGLHEQAILQTKTGVWRIAACSGSRGRVLADRMTDPGRP